MGKGLRASGKILERLIRRTAFQGIAGIALTLAFTSSDVHARDDFPTRPIQMIIPFSAGGPTDIVGRVMGAKMGELLGQQFVVENKTGAGGNIGAEAVAKAAPDGYTILMATVSTTPSILGSTSTYLTTRCAILRRWAGSASHRRCCLSILPFRQPT
jgi:tripartite-type tricarboxylate transporter receptor subunit TctC